MTNRRTLREGRKGLRKGKGSGAVKKVVGLLLAITATALIAFAQESADTFAAVGEHSTANIAPSNQTPSSSTDAIETGANEFGVWGGGSFDSPTLIGSAEDARFAVAALRYARVLVAGRGLVFKYTVDAIPVATLFYDSYIAIPTGIASDYRIERRRKSVYAAGLAPIGLQLNFARRRRVQPFASGSVGFLYFKEVIPDNRSIVFPDERGAQFNYTADFGGGIQVFTRPRRALTFGYKYHHISNGFRAPVNPGFDSNLFYAGYSIFR
ncbi:MAG: acyloxyacyl hydrolase [Acidobacteriota bacterium]|nr:acyloxyacyl hydrolase [Acidobacteriota bacterium]